MIRSGWRERRDCQFHTAHAVGRAVDINHGSKEGPRVDVPSELSCGRELQHDHLRLSISQTLRGPPVKDATRPLRAMIGRGDAPSHLRVIFETKPAALPRPLTKLS